MVDNIFDLKKTANSDGFSAVPLGVPAAAGSYIPTNDFTPLTTRPTNLSKMRVPSIEETLTQPNLTALIQPPTEKLHITLTPEEQETMTSLNNSVSKQLINQFYEVYTMPTGLKDVEYRLGAVQNNIPNMHATVPQGLPMVIAKDATASWRVGTNYDVQIDTGLKDSSGNTVTYEYVSYAFPPFVPKGVNYNSRKATKNNSADMVKSYYGDTSTNKDFDPYNLLYRGNTATVRGLSFKGINDNINTLQFLLNKGSGVESTYINEWDLSIYMQEGLVRQIEVPVGNDMLIVPEYATYLTYGMARDCPTFANGKNTANPVIDVDQVTPWGSFNCAVSTRKSVDDVLVGQALNTLNYEINEYPLSLFWRPSNQGDNLDYITKTVFKEETVYDYDYDDNDNLITVEKVEPVEYTEYSNLNVAKYYDDLFSYRKTGLIYTEKEYTDCGGSQKKYTPERYHGKSLTESTVPLEYILKYADARDAVLSAWNTTDVEGEKYGGGYNNYPKTNAFANLPYWKQFFFSEEDGLTEIDQYWQELYANGKQENSILDVADDLLSILTKDNSAFNSFKEQAYETWVAQNSDSDPSLDPFVAKANSEDGYGNISIKVLRKKIEIPHTALLNMFIHRGKQTSKAMDASKGTNAVLGLPEVGTSLKDASKKKQPNGAVEGSSEEAAGTYEIQEDDTLGASLSYADGVNNHSPMLYGGPHGKWYSPQTIEGYAQFGNETLETVPTMDAAWAYNYKYVKGMTQTPLNSKNFKCGSYLDAKILLGLIERNAAYHLLQKDLEPVVDVPYEGTYSGQELVKSPAVWSKTLCFGVWKWKWCTTIRIPLRYIILENRFLNKWPLLNIYGRWASEYWSNRRFTRAVSTSQRMSVSSLVKDFIQDMVMVPAPSSGNPEYYTTTNVLTDESADLKNAKKQGTFVKNTGTYVQSTSNKVRYLIGQESGTVDTGGKVWNCYYDPDSDYSIIKQNLFKYLGNNGTISNPITVSVPIKDSKDRVIEIAVGNARVEKAVGWRMVPKLQVRYTYTTVLQYVPKTTWWKFNFWGKWVNQTIAVPVYYIEYVPQQLDTYSLYLYPGELKYIIPTKYVIPNYSAYNKSWRDTTSSLIVNRWGVDPNHLVTDLTTYWPFTSTFRNLYGLKRRSYIPGGRNRGYAATSISLDTTLHVKGVIFGDIFKNYVENNGSVRIRTGTGYKYLYTTKNVSWTQYRHLCDLGVYLYASQTEMFNKTTAVSCRSRYQVAAVTGSMPDAELTNIISELPSLDGVLNIDKKGAPGTKVYGYYKTSDIFDSFIETATQQKTWLMQLRDYFRQFVTDDLIYNTYKDVTDPIIININRNASLNKRPSDGEEPYYTKSYTEDINYYDALCIVEKAFANSTPGKNTIADLLDTRITDFETIIQKAKAYKASGCTWTNLEAFSKFVSNTKLYLDGANGIRDYLLNRKFEPDTKVNETYDVIKKSSGGLTYDLVSNPTALIWAYLNVLYQARKFYVNKRLDKKAGSYWVLRALERVLTFQAAADKSANKSSLALTDGATFSSNNVPITFVQKRETTTELLQRDPSDNTPTYTQAVYVKVDYLSTGDPTSSEFYKDGLYKGKEFIHVPIAHKYAYKPADGYYYITSDQITEDINRYLSAYNTILSSLETLESVPEAILAEINGPVSSTEWVEAGGNESDSITGDLITLKVNGEDTPIVTADGTVGSTEGVGHTILKNRLGAKYYQEITNKINKLMYKIYIKWNPAAVGSGTNAIQAAQEDHSYIDVYQYKLSVEKLQVSTRAFEEGSADTDWFDSVFDYAGIEHGLNEPIISGITYGVVGSANLDTIISNLPSLNDQTIHCLTCTLANKNDFWRIEIPTDIGYDIPTEVLASKPTLVTEAAVTELFNRLKGEETPSGESVLMGYSSKISPINEFDADSCTASTQAALGLTPSIKSLGTSLLAEEAEKQFG